MYEDYGRSSRGVVKSVASPLAQRKRIQLRSPRLPAQSIASPLAKGERTKVRVRAVGLNKTLTLPLSLAKERRPETDQCVGFQAKRDHPAVFTMFVHAKKIRDCNRI